MTMGSTVPPKSSEESYRDLPFVRSPTHARPSHPVPRDSLRAVSKPLKRLTACMPNVGHEASSRGEPEGPGAAPPSQQQQQLTPTH
eukprot:7849389-Pyramimonas_sp.AAC.1